jgi:hypothetical protein
VEYDVQAVEVLVTATLVIELSESEFQELPDEP